MVTDLKRFFPGSQYFSRIGRDFGGPANSPKNTDVSPGNDPMNEGVKARCNAIGDGFEWIGQMVHAGFAVVADSDPFITVDSVVRESVQRCFHEESVMIEKGIQMKFSRPILLLLGSVLSASGIGCSAITAVVSDSRPANRENRGDADRFSAIGRVFENQGRYDKAEAMYRQALRNRPQDSELRSQLQQLAERRKEQKFGPTERANAIAMADLVSPPKSSPGQDRRPLPATTDMSPSAKTHSMTSIAVQTIVLPPQSPTLPPQPPTPPAEQEALSAVPIASHDPGASHPIELASGGNQGWRSRHEHALNSADVLVALERPDDHVEMLLSAVNSGVDVETKSLAATLLGDCDPANMQVREALVHHQGIQSDPEVLIALCDSQIERDEAGQETLNCLICLCTGFSGEIQIQAASQLRNFVGTEPELSCLTALNELLGSAEPQVRAIAAATLGDFPSLESSIITRLQELADADTDPNVREAAHSALTRQKSEALQIVPGPGLTAEQ